MYKRQGLEPALRSREGRGDPLISTAAIPAGTRGRTGDRVATIAVDAAFRAEVVKRAPAASFSTRLVLHLYYRGSRKALSRWYVAELVSAKRSTCLVVVL